MGRRGRWRVEHPQREAREDQRGSPALAATGAGHHCRSTAHRGQSARVRWARRPRLRCLLGAKDRTGLTLTFASPWVLHDLRRTCRKLMTRAKVRPDVAELALGHSIRGIQATYDDPHEYAGMIDDAI